MVVEGSIPSYGQYMDFPLHFSKVTVTNFLEIVPSWSQTPVEGLHIVELSYTSVGQLPALPVQYST